MSPNPLHQLLLHLSILYLLNVFTVGTGTLFGASDELRVINTDTKTFPEPMHPGWPVVIDIGIYVHSMSSLDVKDMSFMLDMYFRMSWVDSRLIGQPNKTEDEQLTLQEIWTPDIYFVNAKLTRTHNVIKPNLALWIDESDGTVAYSTRVSAQVACPMDLASYPLDKQLCALQMMSYGYPERMLQLQWFYYEPIDKNPRIQLPEFSLESITPIMCNASYEYSKTRTGSRFADFGCIEARFYFIRQITYHLVQTYFPSGAIIIISWVCFWIDPNAVPARVTLSFTTLLTLTTMGAGIRFTLPAVSYAKAIDHWFFVCTIFMFSSLGEFAWVNVYNRRSLSCAQKAKDMLDRLAAQESDTKFDNMGISAPMESYAAVMMQNASESYKKMAHYIDYISRFLFPGAFALFNLLYWGYYTGLFD